jgi:hypothetical protein
MQFQPKLATTGVASTDILTTPGNPYAEGTQLMFAAITGGAGLATGTVYYATGVSGSTFQLSATTGGAPINFTTDITAATLFQPGLLTGAATSPGIFPVEMIATNGTGPSPAVQFTIGIEPAAVAPDTAVDAVWDVGPNNVIPQTDSTLNLTPVAAGVPAFFAKSGMDLMIRFRLVKDGSVIAPTVSAFQIVLKEFEPDAQIITGTAFSQLGTGDGTNYLLYCHVDGNALEAALSNYEKNPGTLFNALAEVQLTYANAFGIGPGSLVLPSRTFLIEIDRALS